MKFTNGSWLVRKEFEPIYAVEYGYHRVKGGRLCVYAPGVHIGGKGDTVNAPVFTVAFTSPRENVIRTEITHFRGAVRKGPFFEVDTEDVRTEVTEEDDRLIYRSGKLEAVISKEPGAWQVDYRYEGRLLTRSGYRNMAHMSDRISGMTSMTDQLVLDLDGQIYGLGERCLRVV